MYLLNKINLNKKMISFLKNLKIILILYNNLNYQINKTRVHKKTKKKTLPRLKLFLKKIKTKKRNPIIDEDYFYSSKNPFFLFLIYL
jgi:hypothetical protein